MKLCRFELSSRPGEPRSGLTYDGRVYETDGETAIGIHELTDVRFLSPLGTIPSIRLFDQEMGEGGEIRHTYSYIHPRQIRGPLEEIEMLPQLGGAELEVRVASVVQDSGTLIDLTEAPSFILGYTILLVLSIPELELGTAVRRDMGGWLGTFLVTPDDLGDALLRGQTTHFESPYRLTVGRETVLEGIWRPQHSMAELLADATQIGRAATGDVIAWPPLASGSLEDSSLGRLLLPGDRIQVDVEALGTLVGRIS